MVFGFRHRSSAAQSLARYLSSKYRCCFLLPRLQWFRWYPRVLLLLSVKALCGFAKSPVRSIGPVDLTVGTVQGNQPVPTVTDNLYQQGTISNESIGIFFQPTTSGGPVVNGELTFGDIDATKYAQIFVHL
jgi:hypothetical protein